MKRKKSSIGCLFWIALILLVLVIFLFNRKTIETVMENTGFWDVVRTDKVVPEVQRTTEDPAPSGQSDGNTVITTPSPEQPEPAPRVEPQPEVVEVAPPREEEELVEVPPATPPATDGQMRRSRLYFVKVEPDGNIALKGIVRPVYFQDSPLTETIVSLLKGLSVSEINQGLLSLIPGETRLLSVSVVEGRAFLNFSEEFLFNSFGREGYTAQVQQIVFTATEFPTVKQVQILINGEKRDYMGSEGGIYLGAPLSREAFQ
jgi:spore germination protein GerM